MEKRDIYVTMALLAILIALSIASSEQAIKMKGDPGKGLVVSHLSRK